MRSGLLAFGLLFVGAALGVTAGSVPSLAVVLYVIGAACLLIALLTWPPVLRRVPIVGPWWKRHQRRPIAELRRDCLSLSADILRFVNDRRRAEPSIVFDRADWDRQTEAMIRYGTETSVDYHERFGARVGAVIGELRDRGLSIPSGLRPDFQVNTIGMSILAQEIGAIGLRLPD